MIETITRNAALPLRLRKKIGKLNKPAAGIKFTMKLFEARYDGTTGNHIDNKIYLYGLHEVATIRLMRAILRQQRQNKIAPVLMDVGTNSGVHLLATAALADRAVGFEPWSPLRTETTRQVQANGFHHVTICDFGLGEADDNLPFLAPVGSNHGIGMFVGNGAGEREEAEQSSGAKMSDAVTLKVRRGDAVVAELGLAPTLIKIDTEGFDYRVLKGLSQTLRTHKPAVFFEYSALSRRDFDKPDAVREVFGDGYRLYGLKPSRERPALIPFTVGGRYENILAWAGRDDDLRRLAADQS